MSTRSFIMKQVSAENKEGTWAKGTYHHWDGYPNGAVHETLKNGFKKGGWEFVEEALKHSWSAIWDGDCHCCGTMDDGRKEDVSYLPLEPKDDMGTEYMYVFAREGLDNPMEGADQYNCVDWLKVYESSWDSSDWKLIEQTQLHTENTDYITDHMLSGILRYK
jgi:hypothetical protein